MKEQQPNHSDEKWLDSLPGEVRRIFAVALLNILLKVMGMEFSQESKKNIRELNERLKEGSVIMYANHTALVDFVVAALLALSELTNAEMIFGPVASQYVEPDDTKRFSKNKVIAFILKRIGPLGITLLPIDTATTPNTNMTPEKRRARRAKRARLRAVAKDALSKPGSALGITPQGTRSKDEAGSMMEALPGVGSFDDPNQKIPITYLPFAMIYWRYFHDNPALVVGRVQTLDELLAEEGLNREKVPKNPEEKAKFITKLLMQKLAALQPESMRGFYAKKEADEVIV